MVGIVELVVDSEEIEDSVYLLIVHFNKLLYDIGLWDLSSNMERKDKLGSIIRDWQCLD